ncbi:MAG: hypothetical protein H6745_26155 [Deltaproteobacteria bacterium]|nr:hypothetical protein [Deltaproteobacteria bacterium]
MKTTARPTPPRGPLARLALVATCAVLASATACGDDDDGAPDAAADTTPGDTAPGDTADGALPGDTGGGDVSDTAAAETDADASPGACGVDGPLPAFAVAAAGGFPIVATCDGVTVRVTPLADGVARVEQLLDGASGPSRGWAPAGELVPASDATAGAGGGALVVCTPELTVRVEPGTCRVTATDGGGAVVVDDVGVARAGGSTVLTVATPAGERFYGFGEHTGPLDRRGTVMRNFNTDAYDTAYGGWAPDADPLYLGVPFFAALRGGVAHGVLVDDPRDITWDMAKTDAARWTLTTARDRVDRYLIAGPTLADVLRRYTALTGRAPRPPRWALGFHQSRWGYAPDTSFAAVGAELRSRRIPADALWLDIQHLDRYRTFTWDPATFPDPEGLMAGLRADGFRTVVISDPGLAPVEGWSVYDEGLAADAFLRKASGQIYLGKVWPGQSVFPDFTLPAARALWAEQVRLNALRGVAGVWLDVNEPTTFPEGGGGQTIPADVVAAGDGEATTMAEVHNVYALREAEATRDGLLAAAPARRPFILSRAGYAGIQRYAAIWTGDAPSTWASLAQTLPMLLNLGMSGVPFVGSDVGGYSGGATPELYARWMALGSVSPFFRAHVTSGVAGQEPWAFGVEVEDVSRALIEARYALLPYLESVFAEASEVGAPVLRPLAWDFPADDVAGGLGDEALLGPWLLVAPAVTEGATSRKVYLPAGRWFERRSGAAYDGPAEIDVDLRLAALPTFAREGGIVPLQGPSQTAAVRAAGPLELEVWPARDAETRFTLVEDAGDGFDAPGLVTYVLGGDAGGAVLVAEARAGAAAPAGRQVVVRARRVDAAPTAVTLDGAAVAAAGSREAAEAGEGWWWDEADLALVVGFAERDGFRLDARYDRAVALPGPPVAVRLAVSLPDGTPESAVVHVATDADGWLFHPLSRLSETHAGGVVMVPRGRWFEYKYSWGDWCTVEKWPGCEEAANRYAFGAARPVKEDRVFGWRAWCDPCR